jgi:hypothetical protein
MAELYRASYQAPTQKKAATLGIRLGLERTEAKLLGIYS